MKEYISYFDYEFLFIEHFYKTFIEMQFGYRKQRSARDVPVKLTGVSAYKWMGFKFSLITIRL